MPVALARAWSLTIRGPQKPQGRKSGKAGTAIRVVPVLQVPLLGASPETVFIQTVRVGMKAPATANHDMETPSFLECFSLARHCIR